MVASLVGGTILFLMPPPAGFFILDLFGTVGQVAASLSSNIVRPSR